MEDPHLSDWAIRKIVLTTMAEVGGNKAWRPVSPAPLPFRKYDKSVVRKRKLKHSVIRSVQYTHGRSKWQINSYRASILTLLGSGRNTQ